MTSSGTFSASRSAKYTPGHPPQRLCLLRLSALGDITHVLPTLRTLQAHWPETEITWIIGKTEYQLVKAIEGVHFVIFDKSKGFAAYRELRKDLRHKLAGERFDFLLHMQLSLRASMASLFIPADTKLGFDKARAKDLQSMFCDQQITPASTRQHVLDSFLEFPRHFGLEPVMAWQLPVDAAAIDSVKRKIASDRPLFVINPCAVAKSKDWRNWTVDGYAAIADYVVERYGMQVVLTGGSSELEIEIAKEIIASCRQAQPVNLVAQTSIDELVAVLECANMVLAPDTGPVHIASALNTKTIGLYATTNPDRAGPYNFQRYVVNRYPDALLKYNQHTIDEAAWGERVKTAEAMRLITVDDVKRQIDRLAEKDDA